MTAGLFILVIVATSIAGGYLAGYAACYRDVSK